MRVCHVAPFPLGEHLPDLDHQVVELARAGVYTHVICTGLRRLPSFDHPLLDIHVIDPDSQANGSHRLQWTERVGDRLRLIRPDLVHVYGFRGAARLPACLTDKAWVYDVRTGTIGSRPRAAIGNRLKRVESRSFNHSVTIHPELARKIWGNSWREHASVVPLGADFDRFKPGSNVDPEACAVRTRLGVGDTDVLIVYVGSLQRIRKPRTMLQLAERLKGDRRLKWLIIGDGSELGRLKLQMKERGLTDQVAMPGRVPHQALHGLLSACDMGLAYVPRRRAFDAQPPLKTIEMLASGLPVVATATQGNAWFVSDKVTGLLCDDTLESLEAGVQHMCASLPMFRHRLGMIRSRLEEQFSWRSIVRRELLPLYERLVWSG